MAVNISREGPKAVLAFAAILVAAGATFLWLASSEASFNLRAVETVGHVRSISDCYEGGANAPPTCHVSMTYTVRGGRSTWIAVWKPGQN